MSPRHRKASGRAPTTGSSGKAERMAASITFRRMTEGERLAAALEATYRTAFGAQDGTALGRTVATVALALKTSEGMAARYLRRLVALGDVAAHPPLEEKHTGMTRRTYRVVHPRAVPARAAALRKGFQFTAVPRG